MRDKPHADILDRHLYEVLIKEQFTDSLNLLEELVDYGTNLVPRCFATSDKKLHDVVILISFLKHAVGLLDSIHVLAEKGATTSCFILLRSLVEINIYLDWIFKEDTEKRGSLYFVWDLRQRLYWTLSAKKGTPQHAAHQVHMKDASIGAELKGIDPQAIDTEIELINRKLNTPECSRINEEFNKLDFQLNDQKWYRPGGVNTIREMAKEVRKEGIYKVLYGPFSSETHGLTFDKQVRFSKDQIIFEPIRNLTEIDQIFRNAFNFSMLIYRSVLRHYRPEEIQNFNRKYVEEWRGRFRSIKKVEYKDGIYTISKHQIS